MKRLIIISAWAIGFFLGGAGLLGIALVGLVVTGFEDETVIKGLGPAAITIPFLCGATGVGLGFFGKLPGTKISN